MGESKYLALTLVAPFQSWGASSKFKERTTLEHPTRSGIIGILCAACGVDREDVQGLQRINEVSIKVYTFARGRRLTDFHTVGGGYDSKFLNVSVKADGTSGDTVITHRDYLQESRFGIIVSGKASLVESLADAVRNPKWGVWLGRKNCIPSEPLFTALTDEESAAVAALKKRDDSEPIQIVAEVSSLEESSDSIMDIPLDFSKRKYASRRVVRETM